MLVTSYKPIRSLRRICQELGLSYYARRQLEVPDAVFNFGATSPCVKGGMYINDPEAISKACDKLKTLKALNDYGVPTFKYTTDKEEAASWISEDTPVFGRSLLKSHSGKGISIAWSAEELLDSKVYVFGILRGREFRVHLSRSYPTVLLQQKRRVNGFSGNDYIKTRANGWVFCINSPWLEENPEYKGLLIKTANDALDALELDFGAVDLIIKQGKIYVVEVNTAPALKAVSVKNYYRGVIQYYAEEHAL